MGKEQNLEECIAKCSLRESKAGGRVWLITDKSCNGCSYSGVVRIYYCRKTEVYDKYVAEQLKLPFGEKK